jgi:carboxyl-terminal processing protease
MQIMKQYYYAKGQLIYSLRSDADLNKAIDILQDKDMYNNTLASPQ